MADTGGQSWVTVEKKKEIKKEPENAAPNRGRGRGTGGRGRGRGRGPSRGNQNTQVEKEEIVEEKQQIGTGGVVKVYNWNEKSNTGGFSYADIAKKSPPKNAWSKPPSPPQTQTQTHKKTEVTFETNDDENEKWVPNGDGAQEWGSEKEEATGADNTSDWSRQANAPETHSEVSLEQEAENTEVQQEVVEPTRPSSPPSPPKKIYESSPKKQNNKRKEVKKKVKAPSSSVVIPSYLQTRCNNVYDFNAPEKIEDSKEVEPQFNWETTQPPTPPTVSTHSPTILRSPQAAQKQTTTTTPQRPVVEQSYAQIASANSNVLPTTSSWAAPGPQSTQTSSFQQNTTTQYGQFPQADSVHSYADAFSGFSGRVGGQTQGYPIAPGLSTQSDNKTQQRTLYQPQQQVPQQTLQPTTQHTVQPINTPQTQQPQTQTQGQQPQQTPQTVAQQYQQQMAYMNMYAPHMYGLYGMYGMQPMGAQSYDVDYNMGMNYYSYAQQYAMPYAPRPNWPVAGYTGAPVDSHRGYNPKTGANRNAPKYSNQQGDLSRKY